MKTTDLIPIILYQLVDGDKYGYEIVKQIEDISNGGIIIKQPTLYSVLKKLEQGKFISSYWQDSEIGGKRHYYALTDNGKTQLDTYPPLIKLIQDSLESEGITSTNISQRTNSPSPISKDIANESKLYDSQNDESAFGIGDINEIKLTPIDLTNTSNQSIDNANSDSEITPIVINDKDNFTDVVKEVLTDDEIIVDISNNASLDNIQENATISYTNIFDAIEYEDEPLLQADNTDSSNDINIVDNSINEQLTTSEPKFTEKVDNIIEPYVVNKLYDKLTPNNDLKLNTDAKDIDKDIDITSSVIQVEEVKYLNYVDLTNDKSSIKRKKAIIKHIQKMSLTCISLLLIFILNTVVCNNHSFGKLYYVSAIIVCLILVLYPIILLTNIPKIRFKYCSYSFKYSISRDFFIKLSIFLSLVIAIFAYNLTICNSIGNIFAISNYANFLCPILFSSVLLLDFVYSVIIYKQYSIK